MHTRLSITVNAVLFLDDWGAWGVEDGFPSSNTGRFDTSHSHTYIILSSDPGTFTLHTIGSLHLSPTELPSPSLPRSLEFQGKAQPSHFLMLHNC